MHFVVLDGPGVVLVYFLVLDLPADLSVVFSWFWSFITHFEFVTLLNCDWLFEADDLNIIDVPGAVEYLRYSAFLLFGKIVPGFALYRQFKIVFLSYGPVERKNLDPSRRLNWFFILYRH